MPHSYDPSAAKTNNKKGSACYRVYIPAGFAQRGYLTLNSQRWSFAMPSNPSDAWQLLVFKDISKQQKQENCISNGLHLGWWIKLSITQTTVPPLHCPQQFASGLCLCHSIWDPLLWNTTFRLLSCLQQQRTASMVLSSAKLSRTLQTTLCVDYWPNITL